MSQPKKSNFAVSYTSPSNDPFTISSTLAAPATPSVDDKTAYLASLHETVVAAQDRINRELTDRMEQDKARAAAEGGGSNPAAAKGVDEALEEENYGEEVQGED